MMNISYFSSSINLQAMLELSGMVLYYAFDKESNIWGEFL